MITSWQPLNKDKKIALVCTGSPCLDEKHPGQTQHYLREKYNLNSVYNNETMYKSTAKQRAEIFLNYLFDDEIAMIWLLRGGEGTSDILPYIHARRDDIAKLPQKILMGFSDFTPMLIYFAQEFGWQTIHGPGALSFYEQRLNTGIEQITMDFLFGKSGKLIFTDLIALNDRATENYEITSQVSGGTLSLVQTSLMDFWEINTNDKIIMLEDVGEKSHKIGRMLKHLQRIKKFNDIKALIFGDFTGRPVGRTEEEHLLNTESMQRLFSWFANELTIPVFQSKSFGHGKENIPFIFNSNAVLKNQSLIFAP